MAEVVSKRSIVYEILTDFSKSKTDAKEAVQTFEKFGNELEKNVNQSKSLTAQLRELKKQLGSDNISTEQFTKLSIEAAKLEDRIQNINQRVRNLASETKNLDAFISIATGIAGGFAAAQGAVALFGNENKNLEKALLKVQASLAVLNGLQQVQATVLKESAAKTFIVTNAQKVYTFVTNGATAATRLFNAALVATIGGAVLVGIGLLIANFDKLKEAIFGAKEETKDLGKELDAVLERNSKNIDLIKSRFTLAQKSTKDLNEELGRLKNQLEDLPKEGVELIVNGKVIKQNMEAARAEILRQMELLEAEIKSRTKKAATDFGNGTEVATSGATTIDTQFANQAQKELEERRRIEEEKQGLVIKTAKVEETAFDSYVRMGKERMELQQAQLQAMQIYAGAAADVFGQLAGLAKEGSTTQLVLAEIGILASSAQAIANAIAGATASGAATGAAAVFTTPAFIATLVSTVVSAFTQTHALLSRAKQAQGQLGESQRNAVAFAEGTPYAELNGNPKGVDTIPARINEGERIIPTDQNMQHWDILEAIRKNNLDDYINLNYVSPSFAMEAVKAAEKDSMIDYSNRFYRQYLATNEGNEINKKAIRVLSSIDRKIKTAFPKEYS